LTSKFSKNAETKDARALGARLLGTAAGFHMFDSSTVYRLNRWQPSEEEAPPATQLRYLYPPPSNRLAVLPIQRAGRVFQIEQLLAWRAKRELPDLRAKSGKDGYANGIRTLSQ
jgi:hypothetical protein